MNIQEILFQIKNEEVPNYFVINREERNYAAILYALLCKPDYLKLFLEKLDLETEIGDDFGVYFEYAYLRDFWSYLDTTNANTEQSTHEKIREINRKKAEFIKKLLSHEAINEIFNDLDCVTEINEALGVGGPLSKKYIQSPGRWSIAKLNVDKYFKGNENNEVFLKLCMFKWAFNIKPDIVIHMNKNTAICIETKYESGESQYPTSKTEIDIFNGRWKDKKVEQTPFERDVFTNLAYPRIKQMQLQKYLMEDLLGIKTTFVLVGPKDLKSDGYKHKEWKDVFTDTALADMPQFVREMAKIASQKR